MSKIVKYGIYGVVERFVSFKLGKATMTITFSGGAIDSAAVRPATYTSRNAFEQKVIESHPDFKSGAIKVLKEQIVEDTPVVVETPESKVKTMQQARQYLIERGVPVEVLQNKAAVLEQAEKKGINFPNWS